MFILGYRYSKKHKDTCQLLNFILATAKKAIYVSRKNKVEQSNYVDDVLLLKRMLGVRLQIALDYFLLKNYISGFSNVWSFKNIRCQVSERKLSSYLFL